MTVAVLEARGVRKQFGNVVALEDASFDLKPGEIHALVGDNGAGKSTFLKVIAGVHRADGGTLKVDGEEVVFENPKAARERGIMTVFQHLALVDHLDVTGNIFLGRERYRPAPLSWLKVLDNRAMRREASEQLKHLSINIPSIDLLVQRMSGGQRQAVAVARSVALGARILIMDEPTAALGVRQAAAVMDLAKKVRDQGTPVILISHDLRQVLDVSDRITVLRLGRTVANMETRDATLETVIAYMTGLKEAAA